MSGYQSKGFSLIELMIASAVGAVLILLLMTILAGNTRIVGLSENLAQAQESNRLVMAWLKWSIEHAGYDGELMTDGSKLPPIAGLCQVGVKAGEHYAHCTYDTDSNELGGDRIAIRRKAGGVVLSELDRRVCHGQKLSDEEILQQIELIDVFWVDGASHQLVCASYTHEGLRIGSRQYIAEGVESMQITLGISTHSGEFKRFVSPAEVEDFSQVVAVRVGILTRSDAKNVLAGSQYYSLLDSAPIKFEDGVVRSVLNTTIWLPNTQE